MPSRTALIVVAALSVLRLALAANVPLTEDEAYYWAWSLHPALGYVDHPPGVMLTILAFSWLGHAPLAVRLGAVIAEAFAALFVGAAARELSGSTRAATAATILFACLPQLRLFVGEALPDAPYLLCWSAALYFAARWFARERTVDALLLGLAIGGTMLSRVFGLALLAGIFAYALASKRAMLRAPGLWIALAVALVLYAPFLGWNATHDWANFAFALHDRWALYDAAPNGSAISTIRSLVYVALIAVLAWFVAIRPGYGLLAWTILPLPALMVVFSLRQDVESYWLLGPAASLAAGVGIAYATAAAPLRRAVACIYAIPVAIALIAAAFPALPESAQTRALEHVPLARAFYSKTATYADLARRVAALARTRNAIVLAGTYEIASELLYYGVPAQMYGNSLGTEQWRFWEANDAPPAAAPCALFVDDDPVAPGILAYARRTWRHVAPGPRLQTRFDGLDGAQLYTVLASK